MAFEELVAPLTLPCGAQLPNRIVMAPMVAQGSAVTTGHITDEDVAYFARRSQVAGLLITGAMFVNPQGHGFVHQLSIANDGDADGLTRLAQVMKKDGALAIAQLYHGGREAHLAAAELGRVVAPSTQKFDWLPHEPQEMTEEEIRDTIADFGRATQRAIDAGFDGVEVHGANHYLLQQFFSAYSNHRTDAWGGDLERRMAFPLAIVDEVKRVVAASDADRFIVGYRFSPEEAHGVNVGYTVEESLQLVDKVAERGIDYIHISLFTNYSDRPAGSEQSVGQLTQSTVAGRCPVIIVAGIRTADDAQKALAHGELVAIGRAALVEPEFAAKITSGRAGEILTDVKGRFTDLDLPAGLIDWYTTVPGRDLLPPLAGIKEYLQP